MAKPRARIGVTDAEIEAAIANGKVYDQFAPRAVKAVYRKATGAVVITLSTGVEIAIPRKLLQGLADAPVTEVAKVTILGPGSTLFWESLDEAHGVEHLLRGVFGNRRWMSEIGKRGGAARTQAKAQASRANGRKGGRPRKTAA